MAGKAIRTGAVVAIPELLFYIVTKIVAVKIRLGISQPHLLAIRYNIFRKLKKDRAKA